MDVKFTVNGEECRIMPGCMDPDTSLNTYLRSWLCLTGTKFMCLEGGCGCCIVTIRGVHPVTGEPFTLAVNSCLFLVYSCHGLDITTIEGLGNKDIGYHPIQERLAEHDGTQCGFCSPGMVMNMYSLYEGKFGNVTAEEVEDSFGGNICRCTGYRPILDAFKSFATNPPQNLANLCGDIEDLSLKKCPKSGKVCAGKCGGSVHVKAAENAEWHKVTALSEVLQILSNIGTRKYRLVAGNTATGVYRMDYDIEVFIDVSSVIELHRYTIGTTIDLGGNITITEWMRILLEAADRSAWFTYCRQIRDHLDHIATVPVRNVGTIAGNLMIKHDHREFYSDVFLLLETVGASLTITDALGNEQTMSPQDFLSVDMDKKVITRISMPQLVPNRYQFHSYKITDRVQNAMAYMNAGFLLEMNKGSNLVVSARIVYGGVNPKFVHASAVEKFLKGKDFFNNATIQGVVNIIDSNFVFDDSLPNSSAEFRRRLAIGLFYKTVLSLVPNSKLLPFYKSGATSIERPLSSGQQHYNTVPEKYPLTQPIMKIGALLQCSGEAEYVNDIYLHNALWATFVLATEPLKIISSIDARDAMAVEGVKAFYSAKDIPGVNSFTTPQSTIIPYLQDPEELLCSRKVLFNGQPVGIIVAEEMSQAVYAANLVKVKYVNEKKEEESLSSNLYRYFKEDPSSPEEKILPTLEDVLREDPKLTEHRFQIPIVVHAASQVGVDQQSNSIKGNLFCGPQYHYHMETQQTIAVPVEDGFDIFPSTQWIDFTNMGVAHVLGVSNNDITIRVRRVGGAFGGKTSRSTQISAGAAVACYHTKRPIRMVLPMETNMKAIGKRTPAFSDYDVTFNDQGLIQRLNCDVTHDLGCSVNETMDFLAVLIGTNAYSSKTWTIVLNNVLTDAPSNTWMRAPGAVEIVATAETIMEHISWTLKKDPVEVRLANIDADNPMRKIFTDFLENCEYYKRLDDVEKFNKANRWKKRGIAISLMQYHHENVANYETLVAIYHGDGSVVLNVAAIELGQGLYTKVMQIAAATLGVPLKKIKITPANNVIAANSMTTSGGLATDSIGYAVKKCCETLKERLEPFRVANPTGTWEDIVQAAFNANIELISTFQFKIGIMPRYTIYGCACAEIEIDVLTGNFQLQRVDIVEDTGESISPRIDVGQVEGAFIIGLGYWLHEKLIYNRVNGELLTNRSWNYKPPGPKDIPVDFRVTLLQTNTNPTGVVGSKTCSEPAVSMGVVVVSALRKALESARKDAGASDIFLKLNSGTTVENILELAGTKNEQFTL
uniref:Putative xanthine dehydrogenase n=1 Tax=Lutzomyia longipalpis TaxID=7200 RepID=A0A1B0CV50_LUTLO